MSIKNTPLFKDNNKEQLASEVVRLAGEVAKLEEEQKILEAANSTTNNALHEEKTESRRRRKVLDRAIVATDSRLASIRYIEPMRKSNPECYGDARDIAFIEEVQPAEEEKFLGFLVTHILHDQYKPKNKDQFSHGLGY